MKSPGVDLASVEVLHATGRSIDRSDTRTSNDIEQTVLRGPGNGVRRNPQRQRRDRFTAIGSVQSDARIDIGEHRRQGASVAGERQLAVRIHIVGHRMKFTRWHRDDADLRAVGVLLVIERQQMAAVGHPGERSCSEIGVHPRNPRRRRHCREFLGRYLYHLQCYPRRPCFRLKPCDPASVRRPHRRQRLLHCRVEHLIVAAIFVGDMDLGEFVLPLWQPPEVSEPVAIGRKAYRLSMLKINCLGVPPKTDIT